MKNVSVSELKDVVVKLYELSKKGKYMGAMVWGPPGVGKSAAIKAVASDLGVGFIDLRLSLLNPVDLRGLPSLNKETHQAEWLTPAFLPTTGNGILFLDEINLAPQSVMAAGYQLILDRALGDYVLPAGWIIIAAGNRVEDTSNTTKMVAPLANRFVHLQVENPNLDEWIAWAIKSDIDERVITFLKRMPQHLFAAPKIADKAWPSPRSWEFASNLLKVNEDIDAAVGQGVASEFKAFITVYNRIPDIDAILAGRKVEVPSTKDLDVLWATTMAIVVRAKPKQWDYAFGYINRMPKEFTVLGIKLLSEKGAEWTKTIAMSTEFRKFSKENPALIEN